jgi:hypothetical protein
MATSTDIENNDTHVGVADNYPFLRRLIGRLLFGASTGAGSFPILAGRPFSPCRQHCLFAFYQSASAFYPAIVPDPRSPMHAHPE